VNEVDLGGERSFIRGLVPPRLKVCDEIIAFFKQAEGKETRLRSGTTARSTRISKIPSIYVVRAKEFSHPVIRKYLINLSEVAKGTWTNTRRPGSSIRGA
jgi:hypothetical protein